MPLSIDSVDPTNPSPGTTVTASGRCDNCDALSAWAKKGTTDVPVTFVNCDEEGWTYTFVAPECDPPPPQIVTFYADEGSGPAPKSIQLTCP